MITSLERNKLRKHRHIRIRKKMLGTSEKPRLCVYRSNRYLYAQAIDDLGGRTLVSASSLEKEARVKIKGHANKDTAKWVGEQIGARLLEKNITHVVFDRNGYPYHGVVRVLAEAARGKGLQF